MHFLFYLLPQKEQSPIEIISEVLLINDQEWFISSKDLFSNICFSKLFRWLNRLIHYVILLIKVTANNWYIVHFSWGILPCHSVQLTYSLLSPYVGVATPLNEEMIFHHPVKTPIWPILILSLGFLVLKSLDLCVCLALNYLTSFSNVSIKNIHIFLKNNKSSFGFWYVWVFEKEKKWRKKNQKKIYLSACWTSFCWPYCGVFGKINKNENENICLLLHIQLQSAAFKLFKTEPKDPVRLGDLFPFFFVHCAFRLWKAERNMPYFKPGLWELRNTLLFFCDARLYQTVFSWGINLIWSTLRRRTKLAIAAKHILYSTASCKYKYPWYKLHLCVNDNLGWGPPFVLFPLYYIVLNRRRVRC